ncbi:hypothetical protein VTJ04DRAFT_2909 [Mycothermus thermophilus]|uniref:uncharacterized protein n=1 Tax=Humicola insolens TaxID=85995 RepID=UPI0037422922
MTSQRGPTATEAPRVPSTSTVPQTTASFDADGELARLRTLKRPRESTPTSSESPMSAGDISPSKIARLVGYARQSHGSAAEEEQHGTEEEEDDEEEDRRRLAQLEQSDDQPPSAEDGRPHAAPPDTEDPGIVAAVAAARALSNVTIPNNQHVSGGDSHGMSPQSGTGGTSLADGEGHVVDSPTPMDVDQRNDGMYAPQPDAPMDDKGGPSLTYPGAMPTPGQIPRTVSMPVTGSQTPSSPGSGTKKHKCPYCDTEFTRHHNLKSHLLTHSQEKPYVCNSCQMRFRRLHDLKRHSKLHTGEKPHVCPSCDRKFARGDALARHSKGAGGCAGRRQTMNSFSMKDSYDGLPAGDSSVLSGELYEGSTGSGGAELTEEERRRLNMPSIKTQHVTGAEGYGAGHAGTYPPAGARPGGLYPPNAGDRGTSSSGTSPTVAPSGHTPQTSVSSIPLNAASSTMYSQSGGMTESPKALSPAANATRTAAHDQQQQQHPLLPLAAHGAANNNNASPHQDTGRADSGGNNNNAGSGLDPAVWTYFQHLDGAVKRLASQVEAGARDKAQLVEKINAHEAHIAALTAEVTALKQQLAAATVAGSPAPSGQDHQQQQQQQQQQNVNANGHEQDQEQQPQQPQQPQQQQQQQVQAQLESEVTGEIAA